MRPRNGSVRSLRQRFAAALAEDVALVPAARADEVAHVLDEAERRHVQLLIHADGAPGVGERHGLRRGDDDRARDRHRLAQTQRDVARAGRHVDDQVVDILPAHLAEELLDDAVQHRAAPDHRRVVSGQKPHRHELDAVLLRRNDLLAVGRELGLQAEHDRDVRAVDVAVDHRDPAAALAERDRQVDRDGRLADAALAGADRDDVLHAGHGRLARVRRQRRADLRRHLDLDAR